MRRLLALAPLAACALIGCSTKASDETAKAKSVLACMSHQRSTDDYLLVTECEPLGVSEKFAGTWFVGFEVSTFRDNYTVVPAESGLSSGQYQLIVQKQLSFKAHLNDATKPMAYQIEFRGRKSLLKAGANKGTIVLDHLFAIRSVPLGMTVTGIKLR
ncbi:hypothetical protein [Sphingomonas sp.]|uniref:hypothetical protein n=1 Tax=Sphingomonas sp. TaxID=28214 RepID=UPI00286C64BC|nr:hypothetical protein [Sphingomonas sp.]